MSTKTGWAEVTRSPSALADNNGPDWRKSVADPLSTIIAAACGGGVGSSKMADGHHFENR